MSHYTFDTSLEVDQRLEEIMQNLGVKTKAEVVRKALGLLCFVVREKKSGFKIFLKNERLNTRTEIVTL